MSSFWIGSLCGLMAGAAVVASVWALSDWRRRRQLRKFSHVRSGALRGAVPPLVARATSMQDEISRFADELAGDDAQLRNLLRSLERVGGFR